MADAAAARREARRKRILDNSQNRLQIISGKSGDDCPKETPVRTVIPEPIQEIPIPSDHISSCSRISLNNGALLSESDSLDLLSSLNQDIANRNHSSGDGELFGNLPPLAAPILEQASTQTSVWEKLTNHKYDIVLLSFIIQLMNYLSLITFEGAYFFLPILVYAITKLIWFPSQTNSKFSSILMLLQGMSSHRVQKILYLTQCVGVISRDICVFLFTTICIQSLFITLKDGLIT